MVVIMDFNEYQKLAIKSALYKNIDVSGSKLNLEKSGNITPKALEHLWYPVIGLSGEVGEILNKIQKYWRDGKNVNADELKGELGNIVNGRGVDIEDMPDNFAPPTDADIEDIKFAVDNNFEYIAISFVASVDDIAKVRTLAKNVKIISKIERRCAIERIDSIASASDWIMVARGDLGFTIPIEEVPIAQKIIINACKKTKTPVIVATQMLTSMISTPMPTRAEVSDIANAIIDGANCLMVSNETAVGAYPLEVVMTLERGIKKAEEYIRVINANA